MKLQHAQYRALFAENDYTPIIYYWEHGTIELPWVKAGKYVDLCDFGMKHGGYTTEHVKDIVERMTGRKVMRLVAW